MVENPNFLRKSKNYKINGLSEFYEIGKEILNKKENEENESNFNKEILLKDNEIKLLMPFYNTKYIYHAGSHNMDLCKDYFRIGRKCYYRMHTI